MNNPDSDNKLSKWAPEYFTLRFYRRFTEIRIFAFWLIFIFYIIDALIVGPDFVPLAIKWNLENFTEFSTIMLYFLLSIGTFTAGFFSITISIIKSKDEALSARALWANSVKYTIYPFCAALLIVIVLFLIKMGLTISASFSLFLFFSFLAVNSFYTTIKIAEHLVNFSLKDQKLNQRDAE